MADRETLVVYFSRTGNTRSVAEAIARELSCDVEELQDTVERRGLLGYLRAGFQATFHRRTVLRDTKFDPSNYDTVIVGSPVWSASLSTPVRTYLEEHRGHIRRAAFFVTLGGTGAHRVLRQMERAADIDPVAEFAVREREVERDAFGDKVKRFIDRVSGRAPRERRRRGLRRFRQVRAT